MARLGRVLTTAVIAGAGTALAATSVAAQSAQPLSVRVDPAVPVAQVARHAAGSITGFVADEQGGPVAGANVTITGATMALAVTDDSGRFVSDLLPAGEYIVRAYRKGFVASSRQIVRVSGPQSIAPRLEMRRLDAATGTSGSSEPVPSRPIVAAGFGLPQGESREAAREESSGDAHPHSETAWRLRHIKRSILKSESNAIVIADNIDVQESSVFGRAMDGAATVASFATSLFADLPLSGEVNLLTSSAFAPGELFSSNGLPRGIAYFSIGSPTPAGEWTMRAAMSEGDLASWILSGSFASTPGRSHTYVLGLSYSAQDYQGGNPVALAAIRDGSRNAAEIFAFDRWRVAPWLEVDYGSRYARYGYIGDDRLVSPRFGLNWTPARGTKISTLLTQRMVVPGAEEFMPRAVTGPALPPERTFAPLDGRDFRVERARGAEVALEHEFRRAFVIGFRRFFQNVDDQLVTVFRLAPAGNPESVGHYYVGTAGSFDASGWGVRLSSPAAFPVRGYVDYSVARAQWSSRNAELAGILPAALRGDTEEIHDLTTSVETEIPETATRFYVLYRVNSAFIRSTLPERPGVDSRFDVQVNQALPFGLAGTKWEVLVGVRNLFRDTGEAASVYDELLVVRPPKRVVGGFLVRF